MEFYLDRSKTLKFQLASEDMDDEGKDQLEGGLLLGFKNFALQFPVEINDNWVATIEIPKLAGLVKGIEKETELEAALCLHDKQYFYNVWSEKVKIHKSRPDIKAKPMGEMDEKKKSKKTTVEATVIEGELEDDTEDAPKEPLFEEKPAEKVNQPPVADMKMEAAKPNPNPHAEASDGGFGLKTYLERVLRKS